MDVTTLIGEMVTLFRSLTAEKSIQLRAEVSSDAKSIDCDRDRIIQVLSNLLTNAIKFTDAGGKIQIEADHLQGQIRFQVKDTGCGIPTDQIPHVFERLWQAKHRQYLGAGLGLWQPSQVCWR